MVSQEQYETFHIIKSVIGVDFGKIKQGRLKTVLLKNMIHLHFFFVAKRTKIAVSVKVNGLHDEWHLFT